MLRRRSRGQNEVFGVQPRVTPAYVRNGLAAPAERRLHRDTDLAESEAPHLFDNKIPNELVEPVPTGDHMPRSIPGGRRHSSAEEG